MVPRWRTHGHVVLYYVQVGAPKTERRNIAVDVSFGRKKGGKTGVCCWRIELLNASAASRPSKFSIGSGSVCIEVQFIIWREGQKPIRRSPEGNRLALIPPDRTELNSVRTITELFFAQKYTSLAFLSAFHMHFVTDTDYSKPSRSVSWIEWRIRHDRQVTITIIGIPNACRRSNSIRPLAKPGQVKGFLPYEHKLLTSGAPTSIIVINYINTSKMISDRSRSSSVTDHHLYIGASMHPSSNNSRWINGLCIFGTITLETSHREKVRKLQQEMQQSSRMRGWGNLR
jgi:hypothetical protein